MKAIVDTNVAMVANEQSPQASPECVVTCIDRILTLTGEGVLVIDDAWLIIDEYQNKLSPTGQPGVGDMFLKWVLTNRANLERCELVTITPDGDSFKEFPDDQELDDFDPDDRKFIAVACVHPEHPPVWQAVDTQWWDFREAFVRNGITVNFLCSDDIQKLIDQ